MKVCPGAVTSGCCVRCVGGVLQQGVKPLVQLPDSPWAFKYWCIKFPGRSLSEVTLGYLHYS